MILGPEAPAPSCPKATVWTTIFTTTLILLEFLHTLKEGKGTFEVNQKREGIVLHTFEGEGGPAGP